MFTNPLLSKLREEMSGEYSTDEIFDNALVVELNVKGYYTCY